MALFFVYLYTVMSKDLKDTDLIHFVVTVHHECDSEPAKCV